MSGLRLIVALTVLVSLLSASTAHAQDDNSKRIEKIQEYVTHAGSLYKNELYEDAGKKIKLAQSLIKRAFEFGEESDREVLETEYNRIAKAHELLAKQGVELPELLAFPETMGGGESDSDEPEESSDDPLEGNEPADTGDDPPMDDDPSESPDGQNVSFKNQIAPLLVQHCGSCHITTTKGRFNMGTFEKLLAAAEGKAMVPGKPEESRLFIVIENGEMPKAARGKDPEEFPAADLELIKTWILEGGNFDGEDASAKIKGNQDTPPRRGR